MTKIAILVKLTWAKTGSVRFKGEANCSTPFNSTGRSHIFFANQTTNFIVWYKYSQFMLRLNSNNQIVSLYFYANKKQSTFVNSSCHFKPNVNYLRSTLTYTSYFLSLLFVTKYYKLASSIRRWRFRQVRPNINL